MHELSVTRMMLAAVLDGAGKQGIGRIRTVRLVIGELTGIAEEPVRAYFRDISAGTAAEHARLVFRKVPMILACRDCGTTGPVGVPLPSVCPACGSRNIGASGGMQWYIASIEGEPEGKHYG